MLGRDSKHQAEDQKLLASFLTPQTPDDLQGAAIGRLGQMPGPESVGIFFKEWPSLGPTQRGQVLEALLNRPGGPAAVVEALEKKTLLPLDIDAGRRQRLVQHKDLALRARAVKILTIPTDADRAALVLKYFAKITIAAHGGDAAKGTKVFAAKCAACHQLGEIGNAVGPDLRSVGDKSDQGLLVAILDPNLAVEPRYLSYLVTTKTGVTLVGLIASETGTGLTLVTSDGKKHDLLRREIDEMVGTGKSLMPEGLEKDVSLEDMQDLFAYLRQQWATADGAARPVLGPEGRKKS